MSFESAGYQLLPVLPELVLAVGAMVLLMLGAYRGPQTTGLVTGLAICLLVVTGALELWLPVGKTFGGSFIVDEFAKFLKILALTGSAATLVLSIEYLGDQSRRIFEYSILVLLSTVGMMVLISAGDLIMLYLGLELMSLAVYVVAAGNRDHAKSTEAGLKYFVLGALASGLVLLLAGRGCKISAVPLHMWTSDVDAGAPTPVAAFLASAPKVAALAVFT